MKTVYIPWKKSVFLYLYCMKGSRILICYWLFLLTNRKVLRELYREPPFISYRKGKSFKDILVRAKLYRSKTLTSRKSGSRVKPVNPLLTSMRQNNKLAINRRDLHDISL